MSKHSTRLNIFLVSIFLFLTTSSLLFAFGGEWKLKKEKNGVKVYVRKIEGQQLSETKASVTINVSVDKAKALLLDYTTYPQWLHTCMEAQILEKKSDTEVYSYSLNKAPWPVSNRDAVIKNIISEKEDGTLTIKMAAVPDFIAHKKGIVRIPQLKGYWKLTPKGANWVEVVYLIHADPGGKIPTWLANATVVDTPFKSLQNMKERLEK